MGVADSLGCGCCRCEAVRGGVSVGDGVRLLGPSCLRCVFRRRVASASAGGAQSSAVGVTLQQRVFYGSSPVVGRVDEVVWALVKSEGWSMEEDAVERGRPGCVGRLSEKMCGRLGECERGGRAWRGGEGGGERSDRREVESGLLVVIVVSDECGVVWGC